MKIIYEIINKGKGVINAIVPANLLKISEEKEDYRNDFVWADPNPQEFVLPAGISPKLVFYNLRLLIPETDYTVTGTTTKTVTVTSFTFDPTETNIVTISN